MRAGSLVECVDDTGEKDKRCLYPVKNVIYTIREIRKSPDVGLAITLNEIVNDMRTCFGLEVGFRASRFRELLPPIANIEEHINENTLQPVTT